MVNDSFASLSIDEQVCVIKRWTGTIRIEWLKVKTVEHWIKVQRSLFGTTAREPFLRFVGDNNRTLYLMTSIFDNEAFSNVVKLARAHGINIVNPRSKK